MTIEFEDLLEPFTQYCDCGEKIERVGECDVCGQGFELYQDDFGFKHWIKKQRIEVEPTKICAGCGGKYEDCDCPCGWIQVVKEQREDSEGG